MKAINEAADNIESLFGIELTADQIESLQEILEERWGEAYSEAMAAREAE